jgi:hypothetical protein
MELMISSQACCRALHKAPIHILFSSSPLWTSNWLKLLNCLIATLLLWFLFEAIFSIYKGVNSKQKLPFLKKEGSR